VLPQLSISIFGAQKEAQTGAGFFQRAQITGCAYEPSYALKHNVRHCQQVHAMGGLGGLRFLFVGNCVHGASNEQANKKKSIFFVLNEAQKLSKLKPLPAAAFTDAPTDAPPDAPTEDDSKPNVSSSRVRADGQSFSRLVCEGRCLEW
jgi:hypothetical protein